MPTTFWGPEEIDHQAWMELAERLDRERELETLLSVLDGAQRVLDVGGGSGDLSRRLAVGRHVTVIEPSAAFYGRIQPMAPGEGELEVIPGRAEALPVHDGSFDAVLAAWILHYTSDPFLAVAEMARAVVDQHGACVCIAQAAPTNALVEIANVQAAVAGMRPAHHGFLLAGAIDVLEMRGFRIALTPFSRSLRVPEKDPELAASLLQRLLFIGHPQAQTMRLATTPLIADQLARTPGELPADGILLVARRA
jgi:SAM-dependent methyltransferase